MAELTVLMTVYNGESYLRETIESILGQTYGDFIFLIVDNASTDGSREIVRSYGDSRVRLVALPENIGQVAALNRGLDMIDTPLVARMDADDISLPLRFERQVAFMESHPEVGICGTYAIAFDGKREYRWYWPCSAGEVKVKLLFECGLAHPSVMMRKELLDRYGLRYDEMIGHSFDWELWERASGYFPLANIPYYLLRYRLHSANEGTRTLHLQGEAARFIDTRSLGRLGLADHPLRGVHRDTAFETLNAKNRGPGFLEDVMRWFGELETANGRCGIYEEGALRAFLRERLFLMLKFNIGYRGQVLGIFFREGLYRDAGFFRSFKFLVRVLLAAFGLFKVR